MISFLKHPILWIRKYIQKEFPLPLTWDDIFGFTYNKDSIERTEKLANQQCLGLAQEFVKHKQMPHFPDQIRICVFAFEQYYPNGGMNDLIATYNTMEAAEDDWMNHIKEEYFDGTIQMCQGGKILKEFAYQTPKSRALNTEQSVYSQKYEHKNYEGISIQFDTSHDGRPWENRRYFSERWCGIFGYNTGTVQIVPIYELKEDQEITDDMVFRFEDDTFVFYKKDGVYYSEIYIHGEKHVNISKKDEDLNILAEKTVKLFFDTPKKG